LIEPCQQILKGVMQAGTFVYLRATKQLGILKKEEK